jgi:hypothetical protein
MSARGAGREIAAGCSPVFCVRQVGEANIKQSTSRAPCGRTDASNPNFSVQSANPLIRLRPIPTCATTGRSLAAEAADIFSAGSSASARARPRRPRGVRARRQAGSFDQLLRCSRRPRGHAAHRDVSGRGSTPAVTGVRYRAHEKQEVVGLRSANGKNPNAACASSKPAGTLNVSSDSKCVRTPRLDCQRVEARELSRSNTTSRFARPKIDIDGPPKIF